MEPDGVQSPPTSPPSPPSSGAREQLQAHLARFEARFGPSGTHTRLFFAPGRVSLFGAHLDYNGGPVMPTAIDRGTFLAVRPRGDSRLVVSSTLSRNELDVDLAELPSSPSGRWFDYPLGVLHDLVPRALERGSAVGLDVLYGGNLPIGAGLSSSASICVGTAFMLDTVWNLELGGMQHVESALRAERGFVGVQCGIMDPFAVGLAKPQHVLWLDCKDRTWAHLPLDFARVSIGVADTGVRRELAQGEFNLRVAQCAAAFEALRGDDPDWTCLRDVTVESFERQRPRLDAITAARAEHVVHEVQRAFRARAAIEEGDLETMGALMTRTHTSLRELYEVSCDELDELVDCAVGGDGVFGARLTGAGFGGCVVMLLEAGAEPTVRERMEASFEKRFGRRPAIEFFAGDEGPREIE